MIGENKAYYDQEIPTNNSSLNAFKVKRSTKRSSLTWNCVILSWSLQEQYPEIPFELEDITSLHFVHVL